MPLALALGALAGCAEDGSSNQESDPVAAAESPLATPKEAGREPAMDRHGPGRHGPGGPESLFITALHELDLTDAQKTAVQSALDTMRPDHEARMAKDKPAMTLLAAGVRAGKIDSAAVLAKLGSPDEDWNQHRVAMTSALNTLHSTLTKEQRRELVDVIAKRMDGHDKPGPDGDRAAADDDRGPPERGGHHGPPGAHGMGPMGFFLSSLDLSEAQRSSIESALAANRPAPPDDAAKPDRAAMKAHFEAFRSEMKSRQESFAGDAFDANAFVAPMAAAGPGPREGKAFGHPLEGMMKDLAVVVPLLQPAQREALAALVEKGPPGPMGGGSCGGHGKQAAAAD